MSSNRRNKSHHGMKTENGGRANDRNVDRQTRGPGRSCHLGRCSSVVKLRVHGCRWSIGFVSAKAFNNRKELLRTMVYSRSDGGGQHRDHALSNEREAL